MSEHVYKTVEITGSSATGSDDAVRAAISRATKTIRDLRWFEVTETRGEVRDGNIAHWQVTMKIGFTLDDGGDRPDARPADRRDWRGAGLLDDARC